MALIHDQCQQQPRMKPVESFLQFKLLPPEIRHLIWRQALSEWAVWCTSHPHSNLQAHGLNLSMRPVGAAPYQVGHTCKEARHAMELLYTKLPGFVDRAAEGASAATYWLMPERTIVYLGCPGRATDFIDIMHAHQTLPLRHVVLQWSDIVDMIRFCHSLARNCPDLQTFILHAVERTKVCRCESLLSRALADWYTTITSWRHPGLPYQEHVDAEMLLWSVGEYFGDREDEHAAQVISNSGHDDMIHDAVLDYYGRKLATCSSDRTIRIFEIEGETQRLIETLKGHEGAVWCVAWAHPKYGNILASAGYDGKVLIWKEQANQHNQWQRIYDFAQHKASVNIVSWAPHEAGCLLACASSDGNISVLEFKDSAFEHTIFPAHGLGVNSVSWAPATAPGSIVSSAPGPGAAGNRRFVSGGSDNVVKIWAFDPATQSYKQEGEALTGHADWVRDVAWSPTVLKKSYIASASQDKTVRIWTSDSTAGAAAQWDVKTLEFEAAVWRVSWSLSGNVLAVSGADNKVSLWKENLRGEWECVKKIED